MRRPILFSLLASLVLLAACSESLKLPRLSRDALIVAFGDSLTSGSGATAGHRYPEVLAGLTGRSVLNAGRPGETSGEGLQRLPGILNEHAPQLLILIHGGNDLLRKMNPAQTRDNLASMLRLAQDRDIPVVMMGVPERGLFLRSADFYQALAAEWAVPIDVETLPDVLGDRSLKSDIIHPNDRGYRIMAEAVFELLTEHGAL